MHGRNNYFFTNLKMRFLTLLTIVAQRKEERNSKRNDIESHLFPYRLDASD